MLWRNLELVHNIIITQSSILGFWKSEEVFPSGVFIGIIRIDRRTLASTMLRMEFSVRLV